MQLQCIEKIYIFFIKFWACHIYVIRNKSTNHEEENNDLMLKNRSRSLILANSFSDRN